MFLRSLRVVTYGLRREVLQNDIELVMEIRQLLQKNKNLVRLQYVPGHQDKHLTFSELPFTIQLNILMDNQVREFIESLSTRPTRYTTFPAIHTSNVFLTKDGTLLNHSIENTLHQQFYHARWVKYAFDNFRFCNFTRPLVAWPCLGKALRSFKNARGLPTKLINNQHATNERNKKWKLINDSSCPLCHTSHDTRLHVFRCQHQLLSPKQKNLRTSFIRLLDKMNTAPILSRVLIIFYDYWHSIDTLREKMDAIPDKSQDLIIAIATQIDIGCDLFPLGLISISFGQLFESLWDPYQGNRNFTASQWTTRVIKQILDSFRDLWSLRCSILKDEGRDSIESTYRSELKALFSQDANAVVAAPDHR